MRAGTREQLQRVRDSIRGHIHDLATLTDHADPALDEQEFLDMGEALAHIVESDKYLTDAIEWGLRGDAA